MKHFVFALAVVTNIFVAANQVAHAQGREAMGHGGGNGGSDYELQLTKRAQQIGHFLKSKMGSKVFKMLNAETVLETINSADIDVVDADLKDRYGVSRTCLNEPARALITCNLHRVLELSKSDDVLTAMLFHEILGLMEIELGHQDNVSMYPISSKILPYHAVVKSTPISESQIRPEFFGLDSRSYGLTVVNKKTKESLRIICLNDNVEVHRCRNFSLVRQAQGLQAPAIPHIVSLSPAQISSMKLNAVTTADLQEAKEKLENIKQNGFKYISLDFRRKADACKSTYRYGFGIIQALANESVADGHVRCNMGLSISYGLFLQHTTIDTVAEIGKQSINILVYPVKAAINAIRMASLKSRLSSFNKKVELSRQVLNTKGKLSLVGTKKTVSSKDFDLIVGILTQAIRTTVGK